MSLSYKLVKMLCVCVCMLTRVEQIVIAATCMHRPISTVIARQNQVTVTYFTGQYRPPKKWPSIAIFKPRSPSDACFSSHGRIAKQQRRGRNELECGVILRKMSNVLYIRLASGSSAQTRSARPTADIASVAPPHKPYIVKN